MVFRYASEYLILLAVRRLLIRKNLSETIQDNDLTLRTSQVRFKHLKMFLHMYKSQVYYSTFSVFNAYLVT
jgi:hypothetical protein